MLRDLAPARAVLQEECNDDDVLLVSELLLRARPKLERVPVVALLVRAAGELRRNPKPRLAAHFLHACEQLLVFFLRPRLRTFGPQWTLALRGLLVGILGLHRWQGDWHAGEGLGQRERSLR